MANYEIVCDYCDARVTGTIGHKAGCPNTPRVCRYCNEWFQNPLWPKDDFCSASCGEAFWGVQDQFRSFNDDE